MQNALEPHGLAGTPLEGVECTSDENFLAAATPDNGRGDEVVGFVVDVDLCGRNLTALFPTWRDSEGDATTNDLWLECGSGGAG